MFSYIKYVLKKGFYIHRFLLFCCSNKVHSRKFGNNEMYLSQILIYWQLCWRESSQEQKKEKLRIELRFKELWNKSIRLSRFSFWLKSFWWILEIILGFFMNDVSFYFPWFGGFVMELFRALECFFSKFFSPKF
jgi:hypothetical protein